MTAPVRKRLPDERRSVVHKFHVGAQKGYVIWGLYDHEPSCLIERDGDRDDSACVDDCRYGHPGEVFIHVAKPPRVGTQDASNDQTWSMLRGMLDAVAVSTSLLLQEGVPLETIAGKHVGTRFEPSGRTGNPDIPFASSVLDYIFRWAMRRFYPKRYAEWFGGGAS